MAGRIPQSFINDLLARIDVVDVIGSRLTLRKAGRNFQALCPFHDEKTPSFSVNPERQFYYCFGCRATGTALTFLMEHDGLDFVAAVEALAALAGLSVPREGGGSGPVRDDRPLYEVLAWASKWYRNALTAHPSAERARSYLAGRGVAEITAQDFGIGYAPPGWETLRDAIPPGRRESAIAAGLLSRTDDGRILDRFRDRIMFPIHDTRGRVVGFGGRVLGDGQPKYLNSPETAVFHKGRELYGLFDARRAVRNPSRFLLVEGYMDVVALAQQGLVTAVAALGTACTRHHFEVLFRYAPEVVCCFDGDSAGRNAAWRAVEVALPLLKQGRQLGFAFLPEGEDPDTLVRKEGRARFETRLEAASTATEFLFQRLSHGLDLRQIDGRARLLELSLPHVQQVPDGVLKELMKRQLAERAGVPVEALERPPRDPDTPRVRRGEPARGRGTRVQALGDRLLTIVLQHPEFLRRLDAHHRAELLSLPDSLLVRTLRYAAEQPDADAPALLAYCAGDPDEPRLTQLASRTLELEPEALEREFRDGVEQLRDSQARENRRTLRRDIPETDWREKLEEFSKLLKTSH